MRPLSSLPACLWIFSSEFDTIVIVIVPIDDKDGDDDGDDLSATPGLATGWRVILLL